jgi:hypothetical protein
MNQVVHLFAGAHDRSDDRYFLDDQPQQIGARVISGGNPHGDDCPACADGSKRVVPRRLPDVVNHRIDAARKGWLEKSRGIPS